MVTAKSMVFWAEHSMQFGGSLTFHIITILKAKEEN
jgi:hypothetical protein